MLNDAFKQLLFEHDMYALMSGCFYFISYKFNVMGWHISILNCIIVVESFDILMNFVGRMFGKEEVVDE